MDRIWGSTARHIVANDNRSADIEKIKIETAQRQRRAEGTDLKARFFTADANGRWLRNETPFVPQQGTPAAEPAATPAAPVPVDPPAEEIRASDPKVAELLQQAEQNPDAEPVPEPQ